MYRLRIVVLLLCLGLSELGVHEHLGGFGAKHSRRDGHDSNNKAGHISSFPDHDGNKRENHSSYSHSGSPRRHHDSPRVSLFPSFEKRRRFDFGPSQRGDDADLHDDGQESSRRRDHAVHARRGPVSPRPQLADDPVEPEEHHGALARVRRAGQPPLRPANGHGLRFPWRLLDAGNLSLRAHFLQGNGMVPQFATGCERRDGSSCRILAS